MDFVLRLAAGRYKESPFTKDMLSEARMIFSRFAGAADVAEVVPDRQVLHLPLIAKILRAFRDPDWEYFDQLVDGVALGVGIEMPRTPAVFEEKTRWNLEESLEGGDHEAVNYSSLEDHLPQVEALFKEEASLGWMGDHRREGAGVVRRDLVHCSACGGQRAGEDSSSPRRIQHGAGKSPYPSPRSDPISRSGRAQRHLEREVPGGQEVVRTCGRRQ